MYGLRFPEKDGKTDADYMRLGFKKEDEEWLKDQKRQTQTLKEQKKFPREVVGENWDEDWSAFAHKRKP